MTAALAALCGYPAAGNDEFGRFVAAMACHYGLGWNDLLDLPVGVLRMYRETLRDLPPMGGVVLVQPRR